MKTNIKSTIYNISIYMEYEKTIINIKQFFRLETLFHIALENPLDDIITVS